MRNKEMQRLAEIDLKYGRKSMWNSTILISYFFKEAETDVYCFKNSDFAEKGV
jgi:hypothetical protein